LIMLMQLVCVDRVYKRMNCFNIRELQGILKRRFFTDLVNSTDHRDILSSSMIGLRFKSNNTLNLDHDTLAFFRLGTTNSSKSRSSNYGNYYSDFLATTNSSLTGSSSIILFSALNTHFLHLIMDSLVWLSNIFYITPATSIISFFKMDSCGALLNTLKLNFSINFSAFSALPKPSTTHVNASPTLSNYSSTNQFSEFQAKYSFTEHESLSRFSRFANPTISYDFKCGNYIGIW
jgi:hypothetical protein